MARIERSFRWWMLFMIAAACASLTTGCETTEVRPSKQGGASTIYAAASLPSDTGAAQTHLQPTTAAPSFSVAQPLSGNPYSYPASAPPIFARSAILIDANSGQVLFQKNADQPRQVASTQKLLTGLIIAESGGLDSPVQIASSDCYVEPTKLYVRPGETYSRRELLTAMMVKSCNDAAAALARDNSGSAQAFARLMNQRARQIGAGSSCFLNPHGLPAPQYSTARDMSRIAYRAFRQPALRSLMRLPGYTFVMANGRRKYLESTDKLLFRSPIYNGMKTGYTDAAGRCLITSATYAGRSLILVQLGSKTSCIFNDAERMISWGFGRGTTGATYVRR